ncbi:T9SS type A sorting domain-containing protein [Hymenobacter rubripertinctus]|uniref:T9SS C-terminal target domain-containing protein n=1 Tax=Hymenobacter rubripertinctus TaxID=2029981 RepID=A0A418R5U9_9BACT|nr:T9SS type A sorting domain-containing protein [Hymenobacter rubripertinctus]RIY12762.1 T9SS C-terminal target domain-containing protein [Hymenobacter rubripertinctus]
MPHAYRFLLLFIMLLPLVAPAQQLPKVLFDAAHAQMAGNADWVIDADVYDLRVGTGGAMVPGGSESNPQRFPTPDQSGITATTPETYWSGGISAWGVELVKRGFQVETLPNNGRLTYGDATNDQDLRNYAVYVVNEPNIRFTAAEKTALLTFVRDGGGLFMVSDHVVSDRNNSGWDSPRIWNDLLTTAPGGNPFGFTFNLDNLVVKTANVPVLPTDSLLHGPAGDVRKMEFYNGASLTLLPTANPTVRGVIYHPTADATGTQQALMAYARYGRGKVVALGDSSPPDDGTGDPGDKLYNGWSAEADGDHARVITNATIWLAARPGTPLAATAAAGLALRLFPNPTTGTVRLVSEARPTRVIWYTLLGEELAVPPAGLATDAYDLRLLPAGLYLVRVQLPDGRVLTRRVVRQ